MTRPAPHGQSPASARKSKRLAGSRRAQDEHALSGPYHDLFFLQRVAAAGGDDLEILDRNGARFALRVSDAALVIVQHVGTRRARSGNSATRTSVARQSAITLKLSTNHRSEDWA